MLVKKALADMGFEISEAEDGEKGLVAVEEINPDLILLDVTMPVLDGPGMLERLRARGNPTPVLLLTAESGTSVIGPILRQGGVCDYVVKPFKPEQLRAKVVDALQKKGALPPTAEGAAGDAAASAHGKSAVDVLVIDDMENVAKKLRSMLPERLSFNSCVDRPSALGLCRERVYKVIFLDTDIPGLDHLELQRDLRVLQPSAAFIALTMRSEKGPALPMGGTGFASRLVKPFDPKQLEEIVGNHFESNDLLQLQDNVATPAPLRSPDAATDAFFKRLQQLLLDAAQSMAAACHDRFILDLAAVPAVPALQRLLVRLQAQCKELGLELRLVGGPELTKLLKQLIETASIPVVDSLDAAKAA